MKNGHMGKGSGKNIHHAEFARRLQLACENNTQCPPQHYGRLGWFVDQFEKRFGKKVTTETVRRWLSGEARPRPRTLSMLSSILRADEAWLSVGGATEVPKDRRKAFSRQASGTVNVVAGLMQIAGAAPAFPEDDKADTGANLHGVICGTMYNFHVVPGRVEGGELRFDVPVEVTVNVIPLGVVVREGLGVEVYKIEPSALDDAKAHAGIIPVSVPDDRDRSGLRRITDFSVSL